MKGSHLPVRIRTAGVKDFAKILSALNSQDLKSLSAYHLLTHTGGTSAENLWKLVVIFSFVFTSYLRLVY